MRCKYILCLWLAVLLNNGAAGKGFDSSDLVLPALTATKGLIENKGQIVDQHGKHRKDIDFKVENGGVVMFGGKGKLHYQWTKENQKEKVKSKKERNPTLNIENSQSQIEIYRLDVTLVGANPNAEVVFEEPADYHENYYLAHTGEDGVSAKGYNKIKYKNIYPNIDWVVYTQHPLSAKAIAGEGGIKYDFIVHPGGNPADIRLRYDGAKNLILAEGALIVTTPFGSLTEDTPYSYDAATKKKITSKYILKGNELRFDVGNYEGTLVIDPVLRWATYFGGSGEEAVGDVASDLTGMVYVTGWTTSTSNIATTGSHQSSIGGGIQDAYLLKFNSLGSRLWATYYGGSGVDISYSVACDKNGNIYLGGGGNSTSGMTSTGAYQTAYKDSGDIFLVKFNSSGQRIWGTYYGDNGQESGGNVSCDSLGNVYLAGITTSNANIATTGTHQSNKSGYLNFFIAKFNSGGQRQWGTFYGGNGSQELLYDLTATPTGEVYATGYTLSTTGISSTGSHQVGYTSGAEAYLVKFSSTGQRLWGTYYGSSGTDIGYGVSTDRGGNVYLAGRTNSTTNIATNTTHMPGFVGGSSDGFIAKFNANGVRQWGTYFGGTSLDWATDISVSPTGRIYISGRTTSNGIATTNAYQPLLGGNSDNFIASFNINGLLEYATYYGDDSAETITGFDAIYYTYMGVVYMAGQTSSIAGIATSAAYQTTNEGARDAYLTSWIMDTIAYIPQYYTDTVWCPGDTVKIVYGVNTAFKNGNSFSIQLSNATGSFASPVTIGTHTDSLADTIICIVPVNTTAGTGYRIRIVADSPGYISLDNQWDIRIKQNPATFSNSSNALVCIGDTIRLYGSSTSTGITWAWTGPNSFASGAEDTFISNCAMNHAGDYILKATLNSTGCSLKDTTTVGMKPLPDKPTAGSNSPVCETKTLTLSASSTTSGVSYSWAGPASYTNGTQNPTVSTSAASTHAGDYISRVTLNGCSSRDTVTVVVLPKPAKPIAGAVNTSLCAKQDLQLTASTVTGAGYTWLGPSSFTANTQNPVRPYVQMNHAGKYYVYTTVSGCISDTDSVVVVVNTEPIVNIFPTPGTTICPGQQAIFTALPSNGGTAPTYQWRVNGIATGGTGVSYNTTTLNNGDIVTCHMTSTTTCSTPFTDTSNAISMTVLPMLVPTVSIVADITPPWDDNILVTFTATPTNGGIVPGYQWKRNGVNVNGATSSTWGTNVNQLSKNDKICVLLKSKYECPQPDTVLSNCITSAFTGIKDVTASAINIYPNPTKNTLTITAANTIAKIEVSNLLGQKLLSQEGNSKTMTINLEGLVPGIYIIKVNDSYVERVVKE